MESNVGYQKIASHEAKKGTFDRCVLLYSGGLDTSIMLKWIQEAYNCSIVALTVDVGQLHEDLEAVKAKAIKLFPALASVEWEYDWAGYVAITSPMRPLLTKLGNNAFAGIGYNGRGITTATSMGKQLAQALKGQSTSIPIEGPKPMPFHRCYPIGVTSHIVSAHIRDYFTTPMTK